MTFQYSLDKIAFLHFHLFNTSKNEFIIASIKKTRSSFTIIYIFIGIVMLLAQYYFVAFTFLGIGLVWYLFYPKYIRKKYYKQLINHVNEYYKNSIDTPITITFNDDYIETIEELSENKYWNKGLDEIYEINEYYFFKFLSNGALIIPKKNIPDHSEFQEFILKLTQNYDIKHNIKLNWKWK